MRYDYIAQLGERYVWGGHVPFGLSRVDRRRHLYIIGKTGSGKSTLLRNLILQDIAEGEGVGVIDPHGDLAEDLLDHIPPWRSDHVVYFNPADVEFPVGLNLLESLGNDSRHLVASGIVGAFKSIWRDSWGPRLEYILYAAVAALAECENVTLLGVPRMLMDDRYREWVVRQVRDPMVRMFWEREFKGYDKRLRAEVIAPIQNKVGQLLIAAPIRNILGQVRSGFDAAFTMERGRVFIANLSKGRLGEDKANLLGSLLVTQFQLAAMARSTTPEVGRRDFFLAIDEFHNFSTDGFVGILSEARKYRLCLTLAHQYTGQLRPEIGDAVFGNVGNLLALAVGEQDAETLAREFGDGYSPTTFTSLGRHELCAKIHIDGTPHTFLGRSLPPSAGGGGLREKLIRLTRQKYGTSREIIEGRIDRWIAP